MLFQTSVLKKYLKAQDQLRVQAAYKKFAAYFLDPVIQENIKSSKEEEYQGIFLTELFVHVLGYTLKPNADFNLVAEYKNQTNARKADGAILKDDTALGVIELKGTNTKHLEGIKQQAFDYKANQKGCVYVITSNFEKLRFYINDATEFLEFDLFRLTEEQFHLLYLCLQKDHLLGNLPLKIKEASLVKEEQITKGFYQDYSVFKRDLYRDLLRHNLKNLTGVGISELLGIPEENKVGPTDKELKEQKENYLKRLLFKKSQKLIDRFLFIFFAEDRGLLPPNSIPKIIADWHKLKDLDVHQPLYQRFKLYFSYLDTGRKGTNGKAEIFAYNGGLFKPDPLLDALEIDDELLYQHTHKLSTYDFESQVDVHILGHIFENSLNEIESVNAEIEGDHFDKQKSKRKKDGVFYTPKYITKYIVENTVGKLCEEKKTALGFHEEDYFEVKKGTRTQTKKKLLATLDTYRDWLLQLSICDPACGSGAFLNQTLEFLIAEHAYIDELKAKVLGGAIVFSDIETTILENNIYGVDINEESVEIAKLSLWLRTAQPRRKLNDLNNNIKCGNSLIDDPSVAGDKAFHWEREFPNVFKEKDKKAYHITTALHDSRTSQRMIDYKVREHRDGGTNPFPNYQKLTTEEEVLVTQMVLDIAKEDQLNLMAFAVCGDHMHLLLVCEEEETSSIMQKLKSKTARAVNIARGVTAPAATREHAPLPSHAPLPLQRGKKQNSLWTQKYGCKPITSDAQLHNTLAYVQNNRAKHELPAHKELDALTSNPVLNQTQEQVFSAEYKGGFDVVIGNPPYVFGGNEGITSNEKLFYAKEYKTSIGKINLFTLFIELGYNILKEKGEFSFIIPNTFLRVTSYHASRKFFIENFQFRELADLGAGIFQSAITTAIILIATKTKKIENEHLRIIKEIDGLPTKYPIESIKSNDYIINTNISSDDQAIIDKMKSNRLFLGEIAEEMIFGVVISKNKDELVFNYPKQETKPFLEGKDISSYYIKPIHSYLEYIPSKLHRARTPEVFEAKEKLLVQRITGGNRPLKVAYDNRGFYNKESINNIILKSDSNYDAKFVLSLLNSKLINWFYNNQFTNESKLTVNISKNYLSKIPISTPDNQSDFINRAEDMLMSTQTMGNHLLKFEKYISQNIDIQKLPKKLQNWHELAFGDFINELNKAIKKENRDRRKNETPELPALTKKDEFEWMELFEENKQKATALQTQIHQLDQEIDQMVYELYGLTEEEIAVVEGS